MARTVATESARPVGMTEVQASRLCTRLLKSAITSTSRLPMPRLMPVGRVTRSTPGVTSRGVDGTARAARSPSERRRVDRAHSVPPRSSLIAYAAPMGTELTRLFAADKNDVLLVAGRKERLEALGAAA